MWAEPVGRIHLLQIEFQVFGVEQISDNAVVRKRQQHDGGSALRQRILLVKAFKNVVQLTGKIRYLGKVPLNCCKRVGFKIQHPLCLSRFQKCP